MKYFSMFSGIGGFELGIQQAYANLLNETETERVGQENAETVRSQASESNYERDSGLANSSTELQQHFNGGTTGQPTCIGYSEIDKYAIQIYERHFNHKNYGDATKIIASELPDFDLLVGGFPCQAFSIAGKRGGLDDARGTLFYDIARIAKEKRPEHLLLENVKGLLSHDNGRTFKLIITTFAELGYNMEWQVLNSKNFGVPQNRERVFIIGHLGRCCGRQVFPIGENDGLSPQTHTRPLPSLTTTDYKGPSRQRPTILVNTNTRIRRLTPTECERLQAYPDGWTEGVSDTQRYKTLGNGVTVNVVSEIIKQLFL